MDNGISSVDEAEYIYRLGMQLVVTDHHQVGEQLPRAEAVVNPHRTDNQLPFTEFCGVGVAFKLACCLYDGEPAELLEQFGDLVAIGTMGDLVPLVRGEPGVGAGRICEHCKRNRAPAYMRCYRQPEPEKS